MEEHHICPLLAGQCYIAFIYPFLYPNRFVCACERYDKEVKTLAFVKEEVGAKRKKHDGRKRNGKVSEVHANALHESSSVLD